MSLNDLHDVLVDMLKDLYHAEKQLVKALPRMAKAAASDDLRDAFESHLKQTQGHVERLEKAFQAIDMKPTAKVCHAMTGLIEEGKEVIDDKGSSNPAAIDAALIAAAQKVEHYEIASYGSVATFASMLGLDDVAELLKATLGEEEAADEKLSDLAEGSINEQAMGAESEGEEDDQVPDARSTASGGARNRRR